jgi:predicted Zn-dependent peptidase
VKNLNSLPGPNDIYREVLPNGITVLTRSNFNSPSVVVVGFFDAGALFDSDEKLGLAEYTVLSLMRGTKKRTFDEIYARSSQLGRFGLKQAFTNPGSTAARLPKTYLSCSIFWLKLS